MLVLTRSQEQGVHVGDDVEVKVLSIRGKHVRLGITAPGTKRILRTELVERDEAEPTPPRKVAC